MTDTIQERIARRVTEGYRVISQTPTSAQLVRPRHFNPAEFLAMPLYLLEYLGQRDQQVFIAVDAGGAITETGSGTEISRYRQAQGLSAPMRLFWVIAAFVIVIALILAIQAIA